MAIMNYGLSIMNLRAAIYDVMAFPLLYKGGWDADEYL